MPYGQDRVTGAVTHEEQAVRALPEAYRQKMARLVLGGLSFRRLHDPLTHPGRWWRVERGTRLIDCGSTLLTLLDALPDEP